MTTFVPIPAVRRALVPLYGCARLLSMKTVAAVPGLGASLLALAFLTSPLLAFGQNEDEPSQPAAMAPPTAAAPATAPQPKPMGVVKSLRMLQETDGPALEILSSSPLVPSIQQIANPLRLVIDLPNARLETPNKRVTIGADEITALRAEQLQDEPPVARITLDLMAPRTYTWDAAGNRLLIHLGKNLTEAAPSAVEAPTEIALKSSHAPVIKAVRATGPLSLGSDAGEVGSSFTAGVDTAVLSLSSGGEVRVCPGTTLSITPSESQHNLLLGLNTGALETHFVLDASSDAIITPDFRIMLVGPGEFHYAFSADSQGNTCVRALPGNTNSAIVTETLGNRTYQVRAAEQIVFRGGQLDRVDMSVPLECGCPPPRATVERAANHLPESHPGEGGPPAKEDSPVLTADATPPPASAPVTGIPSSTAPKPQPRENPPTQASSRPDKSTNEIRVQVEAPLVFKATGPPPSAKDSKSATASKTTQTVAANNTPAPITNQPNQTSPANSTTNSEPHRGFFRRIGHFISGIFR